MIIYSISPTMCYIFKLKNNYFIQYVLHLLVLGISDYYNKYSKFNINILLMILIFSEIKD
jgi:hypothetical protein